ncbi:MAG: valine--tRNA ligase [Actinobacteria bacterium]|jgi:valyl-tRNA synthetase|nr:valine--tRNA ligase [Actinomycetota bacterium]MBT5500694.1 valine--tRNA ligase [Actinomycetota bacterium]MBT5806575.1 valine--tRNA ligase [Actinomycetota bacterium]MDA9017169.1 valine--tRNA ligase [Actinomycetota bacterium]
MSSRSQSPAVHIPEKPSLSGIEEKWAKSWQESGTYSFDRTKNRDQIFSIDTPPPTVSGSLHVGHVFSYTHTDCIARYKRMRGFEVFYPMGWDDNGLPTERRVQNYFGVRCDPSLPYQVDYTPPEKPDAKKQEPISRKNFVELCEQLTIEDEVVFEDLWRRMGLSVDWAQTYQTIDQNAQRVSQLAFLRNLARGEAYQSEAPTLWDVTFRTAVAQAELEDREVPGAFHRIGFSPTSDQGDTVFIETTRPELLAACVALVAHPDDSRYQSLFGTNVITPVFGVEVPVMAHTLADPEKGSGIAMVCTFGDLADVTWWRELQLPTRPIVGWDGRITSQTPPWITTRAGKERFAAIAGATSFTAKQRMVEVLRESGDMVGEPKAITHPVKFFEKGDKPLEIVTTRQWYIANGGRDPNLREELLARGREITWHPPHMLVRYENWVGGLNGDWLISRQRFFGVPLPIWYALDSDGNPDYERVLAPSEAELPIDPSSDVPAGYTEDQRSQPGGFMGDPDVMDTWATSSLTPQIAGGWERDPDLFARVFPMDLRPQAHEIIRTWLFSSVVRADLENNELPWQHAAISGWILDPDRKKMSKSKGNVVTPMDMLDEYSSDAVRYWAASGRPGTDTAFDIGQMKIGRRLAIKLLNASKFALTLSQLSSDLDRTNITAATIVEPVDQALLAKLALTVESATKAFEEFNYAKALDATETFFWEFTDDYVELVKERAYGETEGVNSESARATLLITLDTLLRLFAPFLPFTTEETWSWFNNDSIHTSHWPDSDTLRAVAPSGNIAALATATQALRMIRKTKSEAKLSMRAVVSAAVFTGTPEMLKHLDSVATDLKAAGSIEELETVSAPDATDLQAEIILAG